MTRGVGDEGKWIFVSHSHKDLEKVRRIRNALEARGHNPLLFFLKCLDDQSELPNLIRREIEARSWFILCNSPNAKVSRWVQDEVEIVKSLWRKALTKKDQPIRVVQEIDLDDDIDTQIERVTALSRRATVFISYSRHDHEIAEAIRAALLAQDFAVFYDVDDIAPGTDYITQITRAIHEAVERGFFLLLLSPDALASQFMTYELSYAFESAPRQANIVPVFVRDFEATRNALPPSIKLMTHVSHFFDLTRGRLEEVRSHHRHGHRERRPANSSLPKMLANSPARRHLARQSHQLPYADLRSPASGESLRPEFIGGTDDP